MVRSLMAAVATLFAMGGAVPAAAQQSAAEPAAGTQGAAAPSAAARDSFAQALDKQRSTPAGRSLPAADRFSWGDLTIPAGATANGPIASARGNVNVRGLVNGDVYAMGGDIVVHTGGEITGSALALQGKVIVDGGRVGGEMKTLAPAAVAAPATPARTGSAAVSHNLKVTAAWYVVALLIGLGVLLFSGAQLEGVVQALEQRFTASFLVGVAAQFGALPLLVLLCVALALTVVGILLIPFAIVAYILGAAGLVTLGVLAGATVAGHALVRQGPNVRMRAVQSLMVGMTLLMLPWFAAALVAGSSWGELVVRIIAIATTWVAVTAGLGAALMARGGVRRVHVHVASAEVSPAGWQTPTPIGGVIAARRPSATPSSSSSSGTLH